MRLGCVLIVTTTALLASCASAGADRAKVSKITVLDKVPSAERAPNDDKRSLRSHTISTEKNSENEAVKDDDERAINWRGIFGLSKSPNIFASKILRKMKKNEVFKLKMFAKWKQKNLKVAEIAKKLNVPYSSTHLKLLLEYINHVNPSKASELTKNEPKVRFGGVDIRYFDTEETLAWLRMIDS